MSFSRVGVLAPCTHAPTLVGYVVGVSAHTQHCDGPCQFFIQYCGRECRRVRVQVQAVVFAVDEHRNIPARSQPKSRRMTASGMGASKSVRKPRHCGTASDAVRSALGLRGIRSLYEQARPGGHFQVFSHSKRLSHTVGLSSCSRFSICSSDRGGHTSAQYFLMRSIRAAPAVQLPFCTTTISGTHQHGGGGCHGGPLLSVRTRR